MAYGDSNRAKQERWEAKVLILEGIKETLRVRSIKQERKRRKFARKARKAAGVARRWAELFAVIFNPLEDDDRRVPQIDTYPELFGKPTLHA